MSMEPLFISEDLPQLGPLHGDSEKQHSNHNAKRARDESGSCIIGVDSSPDTSRRSFSGCSGLSHLSMSERYRRDSNNSNKSTRSRRDSGNSGRSAEIESAEEPTASPKRSRDAVDACASSAGGQAKAAAKAPEAKPELTLANIRAYLALCEAEEEQTSLPMRDYMAQQQPWVTPSMRRILFNWLVEVHQHRRMNPETLHMTFSLVDRFLARVPVTRGTLQLVGTAAWMLAAKFEEVWAPSVSQVVEMAAGAYTAQQVMDMERLILHVLGFRLYVDSQYHHQLRAALACSLDAKCEALALCLAELAALDYGMLRFAGVTLAAASTALALACAGQAVGGPTSPHVVECARRLQLLFTDAPSADYRSVYDKYSRSEFHGVANAILVPL